MLSFFRSSARPTIPKQQAKFWQQQYTTEITPLSLKIDPSNTSTPAPLLVYFEWTAISHCAFL